MAASDRPHPILVSAATAEFTLSCFPIAARPPARRSTSFARAPSSTPRAPPTPCGSRSDGCRAAGAADRAPMTRAASRARRDLALRLPGPRGAARPGRHRARSRPSSTSRAPVWSAPSSATPSPSRRRWPAPPSATSSRSPTQRLPRKQRASDRNQINRTAATATGCRSCPAPQTSAAERARLPRRLRADDAPHRRRASATSSAPPTSTASSNSSAPGWPLAARPRRRDRRRLDRGAKRRLPALLPERQPRLAPAATRR